MSEILNFDVICQGGSSEEAIHEAKCAAKVERGSPRAIGVTVGKVFGGAGGEVLEAVAEAKAACIEAEGSNKEVDEVALYVERVVTEAKALERQKPVSAGLIQAGIRGYSTRHAMSHTTSLLASPDEIVKGEYRVEHTWIGSDKLGFRVIARGPESDSNGVIVSEVTDEDSVPPTIRPGMLLEAIGHDDLSSATHADATERIKNGGRPLTLRFRSTPEHAILDHMLTQFIQADTNESGSLYPSEAATVVASVYENVHHPKPLAVVEAEVATAMATYGSKNSSDCLEFLEFVAMVAEAPVLDLKLTPEQRR